MSNRYGSSSSSSSDDESAPPRPSLPPPTHSPSTSSPGPDALLEPLVKVPLRKTKKKGGLKARRARGHLSLAPAVIASSNPVRSATSPDATVESLLAAVKRKGEAGREGREKVELADLEEDGVLGEGAQGFVTRVIHTPSGLRMAVKHIRLIKASDTDEEAAGKRRKLITEAKTYMEAECVNIVSSFGTFVDDGMIKIVLEYMDGGCLSDHIPAISSAVRAEKIQVIAGLAEQILNGLVYLHTEKHLVHRDIKPENILLSSDGIVKITDFGVSKEVESTLANCNTFVGTVTYMSPERIDTLRAVAGYNYAADIWSLGIILVESAIGTYPYPSASADQLLEHMHLVCEADPPLDTWLPPDEYPEDFRDFVSSCLVRDQTSRASALALAQHPFIVSRDPSFDLAQWVRERILEASSSPSSSSSTATPPQ